MRSAGYGVTENDPFEEKPVIIISGRGRSPYVNRMRMHWADMRGIVLENFLLVSLSWTVIPFESRNDYMAALEEASVRKNIEPFTRFLAEFVRKGITNAQQAK